MWGLLAALTLAAQPAPAADGSAEDSADAVPQAFLDCVADFREQLRLSDAARFDCTRAYAEAQPGYGGATMEMDLVRGDALAVAGRYLEQVLVPEFENRLKSEVDAQGNYELARALMLQNVVSAAGPYASASCNLVYEVFGSGSGRNIAAANCHIRHSDALIENLIRLEAEANPVG